MANKSNWHKFVVRSEQRKALKKFLRKRKIEAKIHYPVALSDEPIFKDQFQCPHATKASQEVLSLPIYPHLSTEEAHFVAESISDFFS